MTMNTLAQKKMCFTKEKSEVMREEEKEGVKSTRAIAKLRNKEQDGDHDKDLGWL